MSTENRPDLDNAYGRRRRSGPPAEDDRDPIEAPPTAVTDNEAAPAGPSWLPADGTMTEQQMRTLTRPIGLQISLAHHQMIDALVAGRQAPTNKKRYVVENAIAALYQQETGGTP